MASSSGYLPFLAPNISRKAFSWQWNLRCHFTSIGRIKIEEKCQEGTYRKLMYHVAS